MGLFKRGTSRQGVDIQQEVFFEGDITSIREKQLFVGAGYPRRRFLYLSACCLLAFLGLTVRSAWLQLVQGEEFIRLSDNNRLRKETLYAKRGIIKDRNGIILAENTPRFQVVMTPTLLPRDTELLQEQLSTVARVLGMSVHELTPFTQSTSTIFDESFVIAEDVRYDQALSFAILQPQLQAFELQVAARRKYPVSSTISSLSHLLGYVGTITQEEFTEYKMDGYTRIDTLGKTGLEKKYESLLKGVKGHRTYEVDSKGRQGVLVAELQPKEGEDLVLGIDSELQREAERALQEQMIPAKTQRGAVIAMDPRDGTILALVSLPAYDNNIFAGKVSSTLYQALLRDENRPLFARAWQGSYPSGSTVKIVNSVAALAEGVVTPATSILSSGGIRIGQWFFPDWKAGGHGATNVRRAIAWSVNTFYYTVGGGYGDIAGLGVEKLTKWMKAFGLSEKTGIDLTGEHEGFVPTEDWKLKNKNERWYVGDTYNLSIGQGDLLVTPLQVAAYTAAIANGGYRIVPHVKKDISGPTRSEHRLAEESIIHTVQQGMRDCVEYGSCRRLSALPFEVAGKTGTAQWATDKPYHAWFTSYGPYESPELVITVLLEEGGEGSSYAVPVADRIWRFWWDKRKKSL